MTVREMKQDAVNLIYQVDDFTYHSSRHTTATLAITAGADISAVKEMLGHGSVTSTEVYAN